MGKLNLHRHFLKLQASHPLVYLRAEMNYDYTAVGINASAVPQLLTNQIVSPI